MPFFLLLHYSLSQIFLKYDYDKYLRFPEHLMIPAGTETGPDRHGFALVKGERDQGADRQIQEKHDY